MNNIKFQHVLALLAVAFVIWLYMDSRKKATAAVVADIAPIGDEANKRNVGGSSSSDVGNYNLVATPAPIIITSAASGMRSYPVGTVYAGASQTTQDQQGGGVGVGGTGSGGATSGGGMGMATN